MRRFGDPCTDADNSLLGTCTGFPINGCCKALASSCLGLADQTRAAGAETLKVDASASQTVYAVVDAPSSLNGTFWIAISGP